MTIDTAAEALKGIPGLKMKSLKQRREKGMDLGFFKLFGLVTGAGALLAVPVILLFPPSDRYGECVRASDNFAFPARRWTNNVGDNYWYVTDHNGVTVTVSGENSADWVCRITKPASQ